MQDMSTTPPNIMLEDDLVDPEALAISKMPLRDRVSQVFT